MKIKLILLVSVFISINSFSQDKIVEKVNYANIEIDVPVNYKANSEYEIENDNFSAQWLYLSNEMYEQNIQIQIIKQFEEQTQAKEISGINFISNGGKFVGKIYKLKNNVLKYKILASGIVNNQPLVLNLGFKNEPKSNNDLDLFMQNFIKLDN